MPCTKETSMAEHSIAYEAKPKKEMKFFEEALAKMLNPDLADVILYEQNN